MEYEQELCVLRGLGGGFNFPLRFGLFSIRSTAYIRIKVQST